MQIEDKDLKILSVARTISGFRAGRSPADQSREVIGVYDTLLEIISNANVARRVSGLLNVHEAQIRSDVQAMIDILLFNGENNPYTSLGLPAYSSDADVNRRWKSLIVLYHPDKYSNRMGYEERAKRINEAYEKIHSTGGRQILPKPAATIQKATVRRRSGFKRALHLRYLKYFPGFILGTVIVMAVISAVLFISHLKHPHVDSQVEEQASFSR